MVGLVHGAAVYGGPLGIRVNGVAPGIVPTELFAAAWNVGGAAPGEAIRASVASVFWAFLGLESAAVVAASKAQIRPALATHHHGSPTWNFTGSPAAAPIATNARATACKYPIASAFAGDSKVDGGSHPVSAGDPSLARCFQSSGQ